MNKRLNVSVKAFWNPYIKLSKLQKSLPSLSSKYYRANRVMVNARSLIMHSIYKQHIQ